MMTEYNEILMEIEKLPDVFGKVDILDDERVRLNLAAKREKLSENDHLVICISRTQGSAGNDIGFELADNLKINYYDVEIFDQVMKRLEADKDAVNDAENFVDFNKYTKKSGGSLKTRFREFNRYHGLPKQDAVFFNMSDLICNLAKTEDCIIMGRCADMTPEKQSYPSYQFVYQCSVFGSCGTYYGCQKHEPEAGSEVPEKNGQTAQKILSVLYR